MDRFGIRRDGERWIPRFLDKIDTNRCIGCGRCYKVCSRGVLELIEKVVEGGDEFGDNMGNMIMNVANEGFCIGCGSCSKVCPVKCQIYITL